MTLDQLSAHPMLAFSMPTYRDITYNLARSQRKTASLIIERDGGLTVRVPNHLTDTQVEQLLEQKRYWIYKNLATWRELNASQGERQFVNGESFLYLGRHYRLRWVDHQEQPLVLKDGYFQLRRDAKIVADPASIFKAFYREKGYTKLSQRIAHYAPQLGVKTNTVRIMDLKHRWASCSSKGNLNFHWRTILAPLKIIDYIVVHELAHLIVPNHSQAFWHQVDKLLPDYREREHWLRTFGAALNL
jgi:predicted metal-dependent hydrolase